MKQCSISDLFKKQKLQYTGSSISVNFNNIVIEKDINVSDKKNLYILLFYSLYNTLHREEIIPCLFFSRFGRNNLKSYNSKIYVIRTNFEFP